MSVGCSRTTSTVFSEVFIFVFLSWLGLLGLALYADTISAYGESVNGNRTIFAFIFGFRKSLQMRRMPNQTLERMTTALAFFGKFGHRGRGGHTLSFPLAQFAHWPACAFGFGGDAIADNLNVVLIHPPAIGHFPFCADRWLDKVSVAAIEVFGARCQHATEFCYFSFYLFSELMFEHIFCWFVFNCANPSLERMRASPRIRVVSVLVARIAQFCVRTLLCFQDVELVMPAFRARSCWPALPWHIDGLVVFIAVAALAARTLVEIVLHCHI